MNFQDLHELVRLELVRRIDSGALTGTGLARQAGFQQGHISNFLTRKRSLSLDGLDKVMAAQQLTIDQLMPLDLSAAAAPDPLDSVPVVSPSAAMEEPHVRPAAVLETVQVPGSRLAANRTRPTPRQSNWQRFVAIRADEQQAAAMDPILTVGCTVVLDRHYCSLAPYRYLQPTIYAVRTGAGLALRYVDFDAGTIVLRPRSPTHPVQLVPVAPHQTPADAIVGRVCLVIAEL